jgi:hypothetical protein
MSPLAEFLDLLFREGRAVLRGKPDPSSAQDAEAVDVLRHTYSTHALGVAGKPLEFEPRAAVPASKLVYHACWFLMSRTEPDAELERLLSMPQRRGSAADDLSADLSLRYLPQIHRRAKAMNADDRLTTLLAEILRRWPLSGVLADLDDGPIDLGSFNDHVGIWLLYAERLARHEKRAWVPLGPWLSYVEFAYQELGKDPAPVPAAIAVESGDDSDD